MCPGPAGLLCDALGNPYPEGLQAAYRTRRVLAAPAEVRAAAAVRPTDDTCMPLHWHLRAVNIACSMPPTNLSPFATLFCAGRCLAGAWQGARLPAGCAHSHSGCLGSGAGWFAGVDRFVHEQSRAGWCPLQPTHVCVPCVVPGESRSSDPLRASLPHLLPQANGTDHAVQLAIARAQERLTVHEDRLDAGASAAAAREAAAAAGAPAPRRRQRGGVAWAAAEEEVAAMDEVVEPESSGDMYTDSRSVC